MIRLRWLTAFLFCVWLVAACGSQDVPATTTGLTGVEADADDPASGDAAAGEDGEAASAGDEAPGETGDDEASDESDGEQSDASAGDDSGDSDADDADGSDGSDEADSDTGEAASNSGSRNDADRDSDELTSESSDEVVAPSPTTTAPTTTSTTEPRSATNNSPGRSAAQVSAALGQGINFGNSLEAPREGDWGAGLDESYFRIVADAGFDHVRLPVSWAAYASETAPYTIPDGVDPSIVGQPYSNIWERVDWAIDQAEANDLMIIVNMHHYDEAHLDPLGHRDRIIGMWEQIAPRYANAGDHVVFELFNEPNEQFTAQPQLWNDLLADLLEVVRETNPTRPVLVGPVGFNSIEFLDDMVLPDDDYLISTVHLYEPFDFTHQGAPWVTPTPAFGVDWTADSFGLGSGLADSSWDSEASIQNGQLRVDYSRQWSGFGADYGSAVGFTELRFDASGVGSLQIGCQTPGSDELDEARIDIGAQAQSFTIDLSQCPRSATGFGLMNSHPNAQPLLLSNFEVCSTARGCEDVVSTAEDSLRGWVQEADEWSDRTGVPIHIGEFGAYDGEGRVPLDDRAEWTATVVDEANRLDIPFSYWEFHADFAAFDLSTNSWIAELRQALIG